MNLCKWPLIVGVLTLLPAVIEAVETWDVPADFLQVQGAIDASDPGDIIRVTAEDEYLPFTVDVANLTIEAIVPGVVIVSDPEDLFGAIVLTASGTTIRGFTIEPHADENQLFLIVQESGSDLTIENCTIRSEIGGIIGITGGIDLTVRWCTFDGLETAILSNPFGECEDPLGTMTVEDCVMDVSFIGMYSGCVDEVNFCRNTVVGAEFALYELPYDSIVDRNIFTGCDSVFVSGCPTTYTKNLLYGNGTIGFGCSTTGQLTDAPLFCESHESPVGQYTLRIDSPASPGNNQWAQLIGAKPVECAWGSLVRNTTVVADAVVLGLEDVTIPSGKALTVKEGVTFKFDEDDNASGGDDASENELIVTGALTVDGTAPKPVLFTSAKTTPAEGDWRGIVVNPDASADIDRATVRYAEEGVRAKHTAASTLVTNCTFSNNELDDISAAGDNSATVTISSNAVTVGSGIGISTSGELATITGNTVTGNSSSVYGIELGAVASTQLVSSNTVDDLTNGSALFVGGTANTTPRVRTNTLTDSKYGIQVTTSKVNIGVADSSIYANTIMGHTIGILATGSNAKPKIRYNTISSNSSGITAQSSADSVDIGKSSSYGNNKILSNTSYCIRNRNTSGTINAQGNFFGTVLGCPMPACFDGSVDIGNWLCLAPFAVQFAIEELRNEPKGFRIMGVSPNPARGPARLRFALDQGATELRIQIFDVAGRLVGNLEPVQVGAGTHEVEWDGRDRFGRPVKTGMYFVHAAGSGIPQQTTKLLVVR